MASGRAGGGGNRSIVYCGVPALPYPNPYVEEKRSSGLRLWIVPVKQLYLILISSNTSTKLQE